MSQTRIGYNGDTQAKGRINKKLNRTHISSMSLFVSLILIFSLAMPIWSAQVSLTPVTANPNSNSTRAVGSNCLCQGGGSLPPCNLPCCRRPAHHSGNNSTHISPRPTCLCRTSPAPYMTLCPAPGAPVTRVFRSVIANLVTVAKLNAPHPIPAANHPQTVGPAPPHRISPTNALRGPPIL